MTLPITSILHRSALHKAHCTQKLKLFKLVRLISGSRHDRRYFLPCCQLLLFSSDANMLAKTEKFFSGRATQKKTKICGEAAKKYYLRFNLPLQHNFCFCRRVIDEMLCTFILLLIFLLSKHFRL